MPNRLTSDDLKETILQMVDKKMPTQRIIQLTWISASTIMQTKCQFKKTQSVTKATAIG